MSKTKLTNQQILEKAIQKAIDGGFNPGPSMSTFNTWSGEVEMLEPQQLFTKSMLQDLFFRHSLLFNHDFAKALWGTDGTCLYCGVHFDAEHDPYCERQGNIAAWEYHLQQMVIAEDPIAYLGEHLDA